VILFPNRLPKWSKLKFLSSRKFQAPRLTYARVYPKSSLDTPSWHIAVPQTRRCCTFAVKDPKKIMSSERPSITVTGCRQMVLTQTPTYMLFRYPKTHQTFLSSSSFWIMWPKSRKIALSLHHSVTRWRGLYPNDTHKFRNFGSRHHSTCSSPRWMVLRFRLRIKSPKYLSVLKSAHPPQPFYLTVS